ncbi:MAG: DUF3570 domain-containing protein [Bacteroidales bacterium]|nr:DUF3570 domain-containing protein [Bacteroidales bacterium]
MLRWNTFYRGATIIKNHLNTYSDNFGIRALSIENETILKLNPTYAIMPGIRLYLQKGSRYFSGYKEHNSLENFYTSDFDLSNLNTFTAGLGMRISPQKHLFKQNIFNSMVIRYNYMIRSDSLKAHFFSITFQTSKYRNKRSNR